MSKKISLKEIKEKIKKYNESHSLYWEENFKNREVNRQIKIINENGDDCFHFILDNENGIYFFKIVHDEEFNEDNSLEIEIDKFDNEINSISEFFDNLKKILKEINIKKNDTFEENDKKPKFVFNLKNKSFQIPYLYKKWKRGSIELNPEYQRNYVWNSKAKSLFIESLFLDVPIPPIYVIEKEKNKWEVVDGKQRISTIRDFIENKFKLNKIEIEKENLLNKKYDSLSKESKEIIDETTLPVIILSKGTSPNAKFLLFERMNRGSVKLNNQELRNAIFYDKDFLKLTKETIKAFKKDNIYLEKYIFLDKKRFIDVEIISRGFAMMFLGSKIELINDELEIVHNFPNNLQFLKNIDVDYAVKSILASFYENYKGNEYQRKDHAEKFVKIINLISDCYNDFVSENYKNVLKFINNKKRIYNNYFGFDYKKVMTPSFYESLIYVVSYFLNNNNEEIVKEKVKNIYKNIYQLWDKNKEESIYLFIKGAPGKKAFKEKLQKLIIWSN